MKKHLAIFSKEHIIEVFSGKKELEIRVSQKRIAPFGVVNVGDLVYIKPSGDDVLGQFTVKKVISFEGIEESDWKVLKNIYTKDFKLKYKKNIKFITLIFMDQIEKFITSPIKVTKGDSRAWVVLKA